MPTVKKCLSYLIVFVISFFVFSAVIESVFGAKRALTKDKWAFESHYFLNNDGERVVLEGVEGNIDANWSGSVVFNSDNTYSASFQFAYTAVKSGNSETYYLLNNGEWLIDGDRLLLKTTFMDEWEPVETSSFEAYGLEIVKNVIHQTFNQSQDMHWLDDNTVMLNSINNAPLLLSRRVKP
ncbi:hypothetical protein GCE9029_01686 [Grimontia celer]|uniref:Uncharacterized protein n=1 Tax=Grimontia celer TaxID=1796497 RepID=A0A128EZ55_9GAMM|nr:regulatory protein ToxS [Grimontia celer]CZF79853.1 hypothetical protein GCE9029_01686 [Grimontia celer]